MEKRLSDERRTWPSDCPGALSHLRYLLGRTDEGPQGGQPVPLPLDGAEGTTLDGSGSRDHSTPSVLGGRGAQESGMTGKSLITASTEYSVHERDEVI